MVDPEKNTEREECCKEILEIVILVSFLVLNLFNLLH